ncbi:GNAT family N-acetyltransferase [Paenibacillus sp. NPDC057934]|uniref:GNAT family N-acetyltransferase n=1 Tax=Paenibacillus sp. NPDC057934 TaxID=3346282 RepID=UPI0036DE074E
MEKINETIIVDLNDHYLAQAKKLVDLVFSSEEEEENPSQELEASLSQELLYQYRDEVDNQLRSFRYYVAVDGDQVKGIIGLYELEHDYEMNDWVGWFCVDNRFRGQQIGKRLLLHAIKESRIRGKQNLCLYTSTHENEREAQKLYEQNQFYVTRTVLQDGYDLLYRQKHL